MQTQINGQTQIQAGTITGAQISTSAAIADASLADAYLLANGSRDLTGNLNGGAHVANNFGSPSASTDLATKGYVDDLLQGFSAKYSAHAATTGTETFTIASGSVTVISGVTVDAVTLTVGDYLLVKDAPATSGTGSVDSVNPANGLYQVTSATTNLSLSRATDMSGPASPAGAYVFVEAGTKNIATGWTVTTPAGGAAFTYGTSGLQWTQFNASASYSVDGTLTMVGTQIGRAAITGNVTIPAGSNSATIPASTVTVAMMSTSAVVTSGSGVTSSSTDSTLPTSKAVYQYVTSAMAAAGAGTVTTVSVADANGFTGTVSTASSTPAITIETTVTGLLLGNGTGVAAAVAGTDYLAPSNYVVRATPSGTVNGSNTSFTLPSVPIAGTEMIFLNGELQNAGASNDYQISGAALTFNLAPDGGSAIVATYFSAAG